MRRRKFISMVCSAVIGCPVALRAQQSGKVARIGFLGSGFPAAWASRLEALRDGLRELGYEEGKNIALEFRWADGGNYDQLRDLAAELVRIKVDVLIS